jgi:hypothetical protein
MTAMMVATSAIKTKIESGKFKLLRHIVCEMWLLLRTQFSTYSIYVWLSYMCRPTVAFIRYAACNILPLHMSATLPYNGQYSGTLVVWLRYTNYDNYRNWNHQDGNDNRTIRRQHNDRADVAGEYEQSSHYLDTLGRTSRRRPLGPTTAIRTTETTTSRKIA